MALEDEFYNAILYYAQADLDDTSPEGIARAVRKAVDSLRGDLLMQGERVIADLTADFAESEGSDSER